MYRHSKRRKRMRQRSFLPMRRVIKHRLLAYRRRRLLGSELKNFDVVWQLNPVVATGTISPHLLTIAQGIGDTQRIGRKVTIKKVMLRGNVEIPSTSTPGNTSATVRIMLIHDKQANKALPGVTDVLETAVFQAFNNLSNKNRFVVLMDRMLVVQSKSGSWDGTDDQFGENQVNFSYYKDVVIPIEYNAASGAITTVTSHNIFGLIISSVGIAVWAGNLRFRYTDN